MSLYIIQLFTRAKVNAIISNPCMNDVIGDANIKQMASKIWPRQLSWIGPPAVLPEKGAIALRKNCKSLNNDEVKIFIYQRFSKSVQKGQGVLAIRGWSHFWLVAPLKKNDYFHCSVVNRWRFYHTSCLIILLKTFLWVKNTPKTKKNVLKEHALYIKNVIKMLKTA